MIPIPLLRSAINFALRNNLSIYPEARDSACFRQVVGWSDFPRCKRLIQPRQNTPGRHSLIPLPNFSARPFSHFGPTHFRKTDFRTEREKKEREEWKQTEKCFGKRVFTDVFVCVGFLRIFGPANKSPQRILALYQRAKKRTWTQTWSNKTRSGVSQSEILCLLRTKTPRSKRHERNHSRKLHLKWNLT